MLEVPPANASAIFKLVCCRGPCPGGVGGAGPYIGGDAAEYGGAGLLAPEGEGGVDARDSYARVVARAAGRHSAHAADTPLAEIDTPHLFDIVSDPFDLTDIADDKPGAVARMIQLLPPGWCR